MRLLDGGCEGWLHRESGGKPPHSKWIAKYFELGLMGIEVPEQYGGADGSLTMVAIAVEEISKVDAAAAIIVDVQNTLVNFPICRYGSDALKAKYLPRLTSDTVGAYALSEPSSGSDAFGMTTRRYSDGDQALPRRRISLMLKRRSSTALLTFSSFSAAC